MYFNNILLTASLIFNTSGYKDSNLVVSKKLLERFESNILSCSVIVKLSHLKLLSTITDLPTVFTSRTLTSFETFAKAEKEIKK